MIEEAIRNGTYNPPTPAGVDLIKKPELWEAYLGGGGWQLGSIGNGSKSRSTIRVAVLIAMPSPSPSSRWSSTSSTPLSSSLSSKSQPTTSHPLELSSPSPTTTLRIADNEEQPLPHLEIGVADIVIGRFGEV